MGWDGGCLFWGDGGVCIKGGEGRSQDLLENIQGFISLPHLLLHTYTYTPIRGT
jgi:hypothetical protein